MLGCLKEKSTGFVPLKAHPRPDDEDEVAVFALTHSSVSGSCRAVLGTAARGRTHAMLKEWYKNGLN